MKFIKALSLIVLLSLSFLSNSYSAKTYKIKVLFTHDMHSYLDGAKVPSDDGDKYLGGWARLYSAAEKERSDKSFVTFLLDGGDFSMGTLFQTLFAEESAELSLMSRMGYDAGTLGNHDFDFFNSGLAKALMTAKAKNPKPVPLVASNTSFSRANDVGSMELKKAFDEYPVTDTLIIERDGLKIGVFGLMGKDAALYTPNALPVFFEDPVLSAQKAVDKLKQQGADVIICLSHSGTWQDRSISEDEILAEKVPGINFIVSGHTHTTLRKPIIIGKTAIGSSGSYGRYLGVAEFKYKKGKTKLAGYRIIPIDQKLQEDPGIGKQIDRYRQLIDKGYLSYYGYRSDQKIALSPFNFQAPDQVEENNPWESSMGNLVTDAFRYAVDKADGKTARPVDISVTALGMIRSSFSKGVVSVPEIFEALSLGIGSDGRAGYPLMTFYISGDEVMKMLETGPSIAPAGRESIWIMYSGIKYTFNPSKPPFQRIISAKMISSEGKPEPVIKEKLYRVCMSSYVFKMLGLVKALSNGSLSVTPKDPSGKVITLEKSGEDTGIRYSANQEIKEWTALAEYLKSFPVSDKEKLPVIPHRYEFPEGRALPVIRK